MRTTVYIRETVAGATTIPRFSRVHAPPQISPFMGSFLEGLGLDLGRGCREPACKHLITPIHAFVDHRQQ